MGIKWNSQRKGSMKRLVCPLLSFVLAVGLIAVTPGLSGEARAVELSSRCSLTIAPGGPELEDLGEANVVVDLYKVAKAVPVSGYDTYTYEFETGYETLKETYDKNPNNADWMEMAQTAAGYALENGKPFREGTAVDQKVEDLDCGLYLLIARGADVKDYKTTVTTEEGKKNIATIANSKTHVYAFAPELISLPSKQVTDAEGNVSNATFGGGEWLYDMQVTLKPQQKPRFGSLEIVKNLTTYNVDIPAVFVFSVEAELDGENVYSDVVTLSFAEAGQKETLLDRIPVGAKVTVKEIYSGASYEITSAEEKNAVIDAEEVASVEFTNDHTTTNRGGGGVNNHFTNDGSGDGWQLEKQPAGRTGGE